MGRGRPTEGRRATPQKERASSRNSPSSATDKKAAVRFHYLQLPRVNKRQLAKAEASHIGDLFSRTKALAAPDRLAHPSLNGEYSSVSQSISWRTAARSWSRKRAMGVRRAGSAIQWAE